MVEKLGSLLLHSKVNDHNSFISRIMWVVRYIFSVRMTIALLAAAPARRIELIDRGNDKTQFMFLNNQFRVIR